MPSGDASHASSQGPSLTPSPPSLPLPQEIKFNHKELIELLHGTPTNEAWQDLAKRLEFRRESSKLTFGPTVSFDVTRLLPYLYLRFAGQVRRRLRCGAQWRKGGPLRSLTPARASLLSPLVVCAQDLTEEGERCMQETHLSRLDSIASMSKNAKVRACVRACVLPGKGGRETQPQVERQRLPRACLLLSHLLVRPPPPLASRRRQSKKMDKAVRKANRAVAELELLESGLQQAAQAGSGKATHSP